MTAYIDRNITKMHNESQFTLNILCSFTSCYRRYESVKVTIESCQFDMYPARGMPIETFSLTYCVHILIVVKHHQSSLDDRNIPEKNY